MGLVMNCYTGEKNSVGAMKKQVLENQINLTSRLGRRRG